ncbi:unnamed protein product, partial [Mesorhabditis spiculigera]
MPRTLLIASVALVALVSAHPFDFGNLFGLGFQHPLTPSFQAPKPCFRFKREAIPVSNVSTIHSDDSQCNSPEARKLILENLDSSVSSSKEAIYHALIGQMQGQWTVFCQEVKPEQVNL